MWKGKVVFPSRLLIRTRRDFPFLLELNKLQRIGIFGGKNNISGETRPGSRQIASTSLAGSHSGLIPKQQSLKTPLKRWINTKAQWNTSNVSSLYTSYWTKVYVNVNVILRQLFCFSCNKLLPAHTASSRFFSWLSQQWVATPPIYISIVPTMSSAFPVLRLDINIYVLVVRITVGSALLNLRLGLLIYWTSRCPFVLDWYGSESE